MGPRASHEDGRGLPRVIGSIFRTAREAQRLSQEQVAALTDPGPGKVSRTMISAIERGQSLPGLEAMVSLSRVLNVEPMEIVERVDLAMAGPVDLTDHSTGDLLEVGRHALRSGDYRRAIAVFDALSDRLLLDPPGDAQRLRRQRIRAENNRALALRHLGALKAAQAASQRAVELSDGEPELQANAYMILAHVLSLEGLHVLAGDASEKAVALARDQQLGQAWNQRGSVLQQAGDFEQARRAFLKARPYAEASGDHGHLIKIEGNIGSSLVGLERPTQARAQFVKAVRLARKVADPLAEAFWLVELGRIALDDERLDEAERYARGALEAARPRQEPLTVFRAEWLLHRVIRRRDPEAPDRHRLAYLKRLWTQLRSHRGLAVMAEFENAVIEPARRGGSS